jgi:hypothetical protein
MEHRGNPYRIAKPKQGVLWRGQLRPATAHGRRTGSGLIRHNAVLTATYLWIWEELAIPLRTVKEIVPLNKGGAMRMVYHDALTGQDRHLQVCLLNFFGFLDRKKMAVAMQALTGAWQAALTLEPAESTLEVAAEELRREARCEKCGSSDAAVLESGYLFSIGILPFAWAEKWRPVSRFLCRRHAIMATCGYNFLTSLIGHLGFPGILTGQYRVWRNVAALKRVFPVSLPTQLVAGLCGLLVPAAVCVVVWRWVAGE